MLLGISEILEKASGNDLTRDQRIQILRDNYSTALTTILKYALDPEIEWLLPKGSVPYTPNNLIDQELILYKEARRLYIFVKGGNDNLPKLKREMMFIGLLEALAPKDALLLIAAKDKKIPYKFISPLLVQEAFPGLLSVAESRTNNVDFYKHKKSPMKKKDPTGDNQTPDETETFEENESE